MAVYEYRAINSRGKEVSGIIEAESRFSATQLLKSRDLYPVLISETTTRSISKKRTEISLSSLLERITPKDIAIFTTQFSALIDAGMPVVKAFETIIQQTEKGSLKKVLSVIKEEVNKGVSLADAFRMFPRYFPPLYVNMVKAGEEAGTLEVVMKRMSDYLQAQIELKSKIFASLAYPALMFIVGVGVVFFLVTFVIPTITGIFTEMHQTLPLLTTILLTISGFLKDAWIFILIFFIIVIILYKRFKKTPGGKRMIDRIKLKLPLFGSQYRKIVMARFTRTLATLLSNGVPIVTSFDIVKNIIDNTLIADEIEKARDDIKEGKEISQPLGRSQIFPPVVVNMIAVGEKSGQLEEMLKKVSDIMETELDSSLKRLISLLEPIMILIMGGIVGFVVISILLPIFEMNQLVR